jgi:Ca2+-binding EF-hand superfamily protein
MDKLNADGLSAALQWKKLIVQELHQLHADRGPNVRHQTVEKDVERLFVKWSKKSKDQKTITKSVLRDILKKEGLFFSRPELLAMMRIVDEDRNGSIGFREFQEFCKC